MVISDELKFPRVVPVDPYTKTRRVEAVDSVPPVARVGAFKREWNRGREDQRPPPRRRRLNAEEENEIRHLVERANRNFAGQGVLLRLLLTKTEEGYLLDVYDCIGDTMCQVAADFTITLEDLPNLLRNLEEKAGLLVDTLT